MVVLDASVILGWCRQDDPHYKLAIRFYEAFADGLLGIAVPSLFFFEDGQRHGRLALAD